MGTSAILVTGFLGSGKTTFILGTVVPQTRGRRFALLVNDFGEIGFDGKAMRQTGLDVIELEGGCVCCSAGPEFLETVERIRTDLRPEVLIVEASGLADPAPLVEALEGAGYHIEGIPCLVDPTTLEDARRHAIFHRQLQTANHLILTKCDSTAPSALRRAEAYLAQARPAVPVWRTYEGVLDEDFRRCLAASCAEDDPAAERRRPLKVVDGRALFGTAAFSHFVFHPAGAFRKGELLAFMNALPPSVLRVKGVCQFVESPMPLAVNWSRGYVALTRWNWTGEPFLSFIGAPLDRDSLVAALPEAHPFDLAAIDDAEMIPDGAFDRRHGIGYVDGAACSELDAAEALVERLGAGTMAVVIDPRRLDEALIGRIRRRFDPLIPVVDYRYPTLIETTDRLRALPAGKVLGIGLLSGAADFLARSVADKDWLILSRTYALPRARVSLRDVDGPRLHALLDALEQPPAVGHRTVGADQNHRAIAIGKTED
jgi:G3E family GTPase